MNERLNQLELEQTSIQDENRHLKSIIDDFEISTKIQKNQIQFLADKIRASRNKYKAKQQKLQQLIQLKSQTSTTIISNSQFSTFAHQFLTLFRFRTTRFLELSILSLRLKFDVLINLLLITLILFSKLIFSRRSCLMKSKENTQCY